MTPDLHRRKAELIRHVTGVTAAIALIYGMSVTVPWMASELGVGRAWGVAVIGGLLSIAGAPIADRFALAVPRQWRAIVIGVGLLAGCVLVATTTVGAMALLGWNDSEGVKTPGAAWGAFGLSVICSFPLACVAWGMGHPAQQPLVPEGEPFQGMWTSRSFSWPIVAVLGIGLRSLLTVAGVSPSDQVNIWLGLVLSVGVGAMAVAALLPPVPILAWPLTPSEVSVRRERTLHWWLRKVLLPASAAMVLMVALQRLDPMITLSGEIPLVLVGLYLITIEFSVRRGWYSSTLYLPPFAGAMIGAAYFLFLDPSATPLRLTTLWGGVLFIAGMVCHGEAFRGLSLRHASDVSATPLISATLGATLVWCAPLVVAPIWVALAVLAFTSLVGGTAVVRGMRSGTRKLGWLGNRTIHGIVLFGAVTTSVAVASMSREGIEVVGSPRLLEIGIGDLPAPADVLVHRKRVCNAMGVWR